MNRQGSALFGAPLAYESIQRPGICHCPECNANRELALQSAWESHEADRFVTQMNLGVTRTKEGHEILTRIVADDVGRSMPGVHIDRDALLRGVTRPDKGTGSVIDSGRSIVHSVDADQQKRHALRTTFNQSTSAALAEIQGHLRLLQVQTLDAALAGPPTGVPTRAFEMIGEALHLIQDSYSQAHTERANIEDINAPHPIRKVRFFGFIGLRPSRHPDEHRVVGYNRHVPFGDPRDDIHAGDGNLKPEAQAAINASREFLMMMLGQMARRPQPPYEGIEHDELQAFIDWHLSANPVHSTPSPPPHPQGAEYRRLSRFVPAKFFTRPASPRQINRVVIHITEGTTTNGTVSWFKDMLGRDGRPAVDAKGKPIQASAHYVVGQDGEVVQMVRDSDIAWHAHSANGDSIGIEHVARVRNPRLVPSQAQYCSSADLVRWLCHTYNIPVDRIHILGHSEADPRTTHRDCPNAVWDWERYMHLVTATVPC